MFQKASAKIHHTLLRYFSVCFVRFHFCIKGEKWGVIPKNGIGTPVYPKWALAKPYPRYWHFTETKQIISSQFMTFRGYYYTLDDKEFGKASPSLRLNMLNKSYFNGTSLTGAKFRLEPGEYEYAVSIKKMPGSEMRRVGMRVIPFAKAATRPTHPRGPCSLLL